MRSILIFALTLPACAPALAKPAPKPAPTVQQAPKPAPPEEVNGDDAADLLAAKTAADAAHLRWVGALGRFEQKYGISFERGEGWDETSGRLKVRRFPKENAK